MTRMYISGAIRKGNLAENIQRATDIGYEFAKLGYAIMVPHLSCYFDGPNPCPEGYSPAEHRGCNYDILVEPKAENRLNAHQWLAIDLAWVEVSDVLIRITGDSEGADREVLHAEACGIPVYFVNGVADVQRVHEQIQLSEVAL